MAQTVNVNFRMDEQLKKNVEEICQRMGMNLTTLLTICCRKVEQERRIPFDVTADADPFYSENNVRYLKGKRLPIPLNGSLRASLIRALMRFSVVLSFCHSQ